GLCKQRMPGGARSFESNVGSAFADRVAPREHAAVVESNDVESAPQHERELRFRQVPMRAKVGVAIRRHEEPLHRVRGGSMHVVIHTLTRARGGLRGQLIEEGMGEQLHASILTDLAAAANRRTSAVARALSTFVK